MDTMALLLYIIYKLVECCSSNGLTIVAWQIHTVSLICYNRFDQGFDVRIAINTINSEHCNENHASLCGTGTAHNARNE